MFNFLRFNYGNNHVLKTDSTSTITAPKLPDKFPNELLLLILEYCPDDQNISLIFANKLLYEHYKKLGEEQPSRYPIRKYLNTTTAEQRLIEKQAIFKSHPLEFIDQFGGYKQIVKIPVMDIGDQMGVTGYLDFHVNLSELTPAVRGFDKFGRSFYFAVAHKGDVAYFFKFFQRYSDSKFKWVSASNDDDHYVHDILEEETSSGDQLLGFLRTYYDKNMTPGFFWSTEKYPQNERSNRAHLFMAQLLARGKVSYPHFKSDDNEMIDDVTIPTEDDEHYKPITLG